MINPFRDVNWRPADAQRREFGTVMMIGMPLLAAVFLLLARWRMGGWPEWPLWLATGGVAAGLLCRLAPRAALPVYVAWHVLACAIGIVVSNAVFIAVYFFVVTPVGLLLRLCGRDPLHRRLDRTARSYWRGAEKVVDARRYFRQF